MAWKPFCWGCRRFFDADSPSDINGINGPGTCPNCGKRLDSKDEGNPPDFDAPTPAGFG